MKSASLSAVAITSKLRCVCKCVRNHIWGAGVRVARKKIYSNPTSGSGIPTHHTLWTVSNWKKTPPRQDEIRKNGNGGLKNKFLWWHVTLKMADFCDKKNKKEANCARTSKVGKLDFVDRIPSLSWVDGAKATGDAVAGGLGSNRAVGARGLWPITITANQSTLS